MHNLILVKERKLNSPSPGPSLLLLSFRICTGLCERGGKAQSLNYDYLKQIGLEEVCG